MPASLFHKTIWQFYKKNRRDMPWRVNITSYKIVVSEIMLQQTQASRVTQKFLDFIKKYPSFKRLATAPLPEVLTEWQGLGYNRRALNLHRLANIITEKYHGKLPETYEELLELPGIGPNTAGSILAFAFNIPHPFIETNIRSVYIHFFFKNSKVKVSDAKLMPLIEKNLDTQNPREWHYALMDYGAYLKKNHPNPSRKSKHHIKQSKFKGSNRELRSFLLKEILKESQDLSSLIKKFPLKGKEMIQKNLDALTKEGFIHLQKKKYSIITGIIS